MKTQVLLIAVLYLSLSAAEIVIPSRGRYGELFQLFDQRTQTIRPYFLVNGEYASMQITDESYGGQVLRSIESKSFSEYVTSSNLEGDAKLDLLLSIYQGSAEAQSSLGSFEHSTSRTMYALIEISQNKKIRKTAICDKTFSNKLNIHMLNSTEFSATHVIIGKIYGLKLEIVLEVVNTENSSLDKFEFQFRAEVGMLLSKVGLQGAANLTSQQTYVLKTSKITTYCNLVECPQAPQTIDELDEFITQAYENVKSDTDLIGNEISYIAVELSEVASCHRYNIKFNKPEEISSENIHLVESFMHQTETNIKLLNDFIKHFKEYDSCLPGNISNNISLIAEQAKLFVNVLKTRLRNTVIDVRLEQQNASSISEKISSLKKSMHSPDTYLKTLEKNFALWKNKLNFYSTFEKNNITCLPYGSSLLTLFSQSRLQPFYFFLMNDSEDDTNVEYRRDLAKFVDICVNECIGGCNCFFVDCALNFSFCVNNTGERLYKYYNGNLSLATPVVNYIANIGIYEQLQSAILYMYMGNSRYLRLMKTLNERIEVSHNQNVAIFKEMSSKYKTVLLSNISYLFDDDTIGRIRKNRITKNPVEVFLGRYIDLAL